MIFSNRTREAPEAGTALQQPPHHHGRSLGSGLFLRVNPVF